MSDSLAIPRAILELRGARKALAAAHTVLVQLAWSQRTPRHRELELDLQRKVDEVDAEIAALKRQQELERQAEAAS